MSRIKIYKREIVHYPYNTWTEYYTNKELADKAFEAADPSIGLYVNDDEVTETRDVDLYFYRHISCIDDYNNSPDIIRKKAVGE